MRPAAGEPAGALVLLHGRGADEHDLYPLLDALDPERRLVGVTPGAPLRLPPGGRHWYRLGGIPTPEPTSFRDSVDAIARFLDSMPVPLDRVVVGGFSQGCVMAWALALGPARPRPAGVVALSGFLPRVEGWPLDPTRLEGIPVAVAHGLLDDVIPARFGQEAYDAVREGGASAELTTTPYPHGVDPAWLPGLRELVLRATAG